LFRLDDRRPGTSAGLQGGGGCKATECRVALSGGQLVVAARAELSQGQQLLQLHEIFGGTKKRELGLGVHGTAATGVNAVMRATWGIAIRPRGLDPVRLGSILSEITLGSPATDRHPARKEEVVRLARLDAHTTAL
jgi:hypothetical protein